MSLPVIPEAGFQSISLTVASPEQILSWSHGEVSKPETINYRTQKPELDGLFCERIFGPTKNWECYCGKYKRIRYKGIVCEKCGVEVTRAVVRRERMGHISLSVPIAHIWYLRSTPSRLGLLLDLPIRLLEQIVYFASYVVTNVDEDTKAEAMENLDKEFREYKKKTIDQQQKESSQIRIQIKAGEKEQKDLDLFESESALKLDELIEAHSNAKKELEALEKNSVLGEVEYREMNIKFGDVFVAGTGAESLRKLLEEMNLEKILLKLEEERNDATGQRQKKILKRMRLISSLHRAQVRPEWMILTELPIIPPDLRPMVQLDGGRFAASDLNDLYRRIINRNNRLKRLSAIGAPNVICRNEKRMLQEAIDTLINNSPRAGRTVFTAGDRRKLRSLSDMLKGKQGRFRQNLLGKRVDYSGRSVIVVGPTLKLHQCGLPKEMAMKLFKPFVIGELIRQEYAHNVKSGERYITTGNKVVWDILDEVTKGRYVLLNRAPTLHRLGIQAFEPVLIEGKAIQIHPLVCAAFNADFDGDQMAVHLPLSKEAQAEARNIIASHKNLLKPSAGKPIITPSQDMVLGCYFLTQTHAGKKGENMIFSNIDEAIMAEQYGYLKVQAMIRIREKNGEIRKTTLGRILFNRILPDAIPFKNHVFKKNDLENLITEIFEITDMESTAVTVDEIKKIGFEYATKSGISIGHADVNIPKAKTDILQKAANKVNLISRQYENGFITEHERYLNAIRIWAQAKSDITAVMITEFEKNPENDIYYMISSGARGNWGQITQLCGMKGLVANPGGKTIELPIKSNLKEGFTILEYFIATHGGRKGKSDTALKTAQAGYLTRRLVDGVQDIVIREEDCKQSEVYSITREESEKIGEAFENRIFGRTLTADILDPTTGEVLATKNMQISQNILKKIKGIAINKVDVRSIMTCQTRNGICQQCYGYDLGNGKLVNMGVPVGIIAAQSIGEPGTQLTMRTFHMGGVAGEGDITQGLTRVEELFEARSPKTPAVLAEIDGRINIAYNGDIITVRITAEELGTDHYKLEHGMKISVKVGETIKENQIIAKGNGTIRSINGGKILSVSEKEVAISHTEHAEKEYSFNARDSLLVEYGQEITAGQPLTGGHFDLKHLMEITTVYNVQKHLMSEVQAIYASQGQSINDKHIEIIVKQMFGRVCIVDPGEMPDILAGEHLDYQRIVIENRKLAKEGKREVVFDRLLLGLTRISLETDSWLSAASFQETIRVLVEASTTGAVDSLSGLKENVIIGKLIPAGHIFQKEYEKNKKRKK